MGELENVSSGKAWKSDAESDPGRRFSLAWKDPAAEAGAGGGLTLAVARSLYDRGTLVSRTKILQGRVPAAYAEINSHDAEELGIANGARVRIAVGSREIDTIAKVDGRVPPGVLLLPNNLDGTAAQPTRARVKVAKL